MNIESLAHHEPISDDVFKELIHLLTACVHGGASIGFLAPLDEREAAAYWKKVVSDLPSGYRLILVARERSGGPIIGSAQIVFEARANGRHRAEVQKVMVHPAHRRRGIAGRLMAELERVAQLRPGVNLLFLDTSEGHGGAQAFYESLGYTYVGGIPGYAVDPDGKPAKNAIYYKTLR
jgi:acetyltransferase